MNSDDELNNKNSFVKKLMDKAYLSNKIKYGTTNAASAMAAYLLNYDVMRFTRDGGARNDMRIINEHPYEIYQVLLTFASQSFKLNNMDNHFTLEEITAYVNDKEKKLDYSEDRIVAIVAAAAAWSPYWTVNLFATNKELKTALVTRFIDERYLKNRKKELDTIDDTRSIYIKMKNKDKLFFSSTLRINNAIDNMIRDDEGTYLIDVYEEKLDQRQKPKNR